MKKRIILSSVLLLSFLAHASEQPEKHNPFEELVSKYQTGELQSDDITQISNTIKQNIDTAAEKCNSVTLTFEIKKDKNHDPQAWKEIISLSADLIEHCKELDAKENEREKDETIEEILHKSSNFMRDCIKLSGDKTNIHGNFNIGLKSPENLTSVTYSN